jgi:putative Mg2+ transporter-C (MgtC) family protein
MDYFRFDWFELLISLMKIVGAFMLTLPIAWEREQSTRIMGLRTFPLVAIASCGYVLVALSVVGSNEDAQARIIQGLMSGIGFIGGGAILKEGANVRGTATAASVWTTGAMGAAIAYSRYEIAILLSIVNYLTLRLLTPIEQQVDKKD